MRTKKRLQALVAVVAMLSMICGSLPAVYADSPTPAEEMPSYKASDYFSISTNPYSKDGKTPWRWEYYDSYETEKNESAKYMLLTSKSSTGPFSDNDKYPHPNGDDGKVFARTTGNTIGVGKYWMRAEIVDDVVERYYAVRTFVAPAGGTVTITADNQNTGKAGSIQGTNYENKGVVAPVDNRGVRIVLEKTDRSFETIWPKADTPGVYTYTDTKGTSRSFMKVPHGSTGEVLAFKAIENIHLKQGEKLRFEIANLDPKTDLSRYGATVYWDPVVSYSDIDSTSVMPVYQASEAFVPTAVNNAPAPWRWEAYDTQTSTYALLEGGVKTGKFNGDSYSYTKDLDRGDAFVRDGKVDASTGIGKYWMAPHMSDQTAAKRYYAVRTFTAPETGNITIAAAGITAADSGIIYGMKKGTGDGGRIRITLEDGNGVSQIWPETDWKIVPKSGFVSFAPMSINIKQGQKLHFEAADSTKNGSTNWDQAVCWDPRISYNSFKEVEPFNKTALPTDHEFALTFSEPLTSPLTAENITIIGGLATVKSVSMTDDNKTVKLSFDGLAFGMKYNVIMKDPAETDILENLYQFAFTTLEGPGTYQASEAFIAAAGENHPDPWRWEAYDTQTSTYALLAGGVNTAKFKGNDDTSSYIYTDGIDNTGGFAFKREADNASTAVGKYWMAPHMNNQTAAKQYYAVRTFTAPEIGNITITAAGITDTDTGKIYGQKKDTGNGGRIRITLDDGSSVSQIWPESDWKIVPRSSFISFAPMLINIKQGQKLHFEVADSTENGSTNWDQAVCWDPVVTYNTTVGAFGEDVTFSSGTDFSSVVDSETAVTVTVPVTAYYMTVDSVVPVAAVYNQNGTLVSYAIGNSAALAMNKPAELTVSLPPITENKPEDGYIKVFLLDSVERMIPLSDIGAKPVLGTAAGNAASVYAGTSEAGAKVALLIKDENGAILHIEQDVVDETGRFRIPVPEGMENKTIICNLSGELMDADCLYTSNTGTPEGNGTATSPLSFQKALELTKDGDKIVVMDEIVLPADFVWPTAKKRVTVSGGGNGAALNMYLLENLTLNIRTDATFENLVLASTETGDATAGIIRACGNVVTLKESVSTRGIFGAFYGGARNWDTVDKTETYVYGGNFNRIYGGGGYVRGDCKLTVGGNTNTTAGVDPSQEKNGVFEPYIYGGTLDNIVEGDCITTITGSAGAQYLYGGSQDVKENADRGAGVKGKTVVNIQGGKFMNVYGMNPPSPKVSGETVDYSSDVTINMIGGTVEALIGSSADTLADSVNGSITINALGGTVTRRIIGGVYNENGWNSDSGKFITGDVNVVIGSELQGMTDTQPGHGIFGGSRIQTNPQAENAKLVFVGGSYDAFKKHINADSIDCKSHHDYLITGTQGGIINPKAGNAVEIIPDTGYTALSDASVIESGDYTLNQTRTDVTFSRNAVYSLSGTVTSGAITASVGYISENNTNVMILALYDGDTLVVAKQVNVVQGQNTAQETMPYTAESGKAYTLKAFFWKDMEGLVPLCKEKETEIIVQ